MAHDTSAARTAAGGGARPSATLVDHGAATPPVPCQTSVSPPAAGRQEGAALETQREPRR
jgi:hypothetical protein